MTIGITLLEQGYKIGLDWLGQFARIIIEGVGIIGLGIIVFTLVLKGITLPFDIYQRVKMRKQTLIMRNMKDDLEKLQKQYANDKKMYNQKMMELYKKNGYSMFGACLPMIISLVVLILAFNGFRTYSNYANLSMYENMAKVYNAAILDNNGIDGVDFFLDRDEQGQILVDADGKVTVCWYDGVDEGGNLIKKTQLIKWNDGEELNANLPTEITSNPLNITYTMTLVSGSDSEGNPTTSRYLRVESSKIERYIYYIYSMETTSINLEYKVDVTKFDAFLALPENQAEKEKFDELSVIEPEEEGGTPVTLEKDEAIVKYIVSIGANAAAEWYHDGNGAKFLWVKNVWYPDVSYEHPIQSYSKFNKTFGNVNVVLENGEKQPLSGVLDKGSYDNLTSALSKEQKQANGYFILIILSIGFMVLSQFISMKSQKESNKYQTVDGSGAKTQKIMLIVMPIIYAIFAFMYSAAFSIYMTMSSIIGIIVTLLSNLILDKAFKKKEEKALKEKYTRKLPWQQAQGKNKKNKKK